MASVPFHLFNDLALCSLEIFSIFLIESTTFSCVQRPSETVNFSARIGRKPFQTCGVACAILASLTSSSGQSGLARLVMCNNQHGISADLGRIHLDRAGQKIPDMKWKFRKYSFKHILDSLDAHRSHRMTGTAILFPIACSAARLRQAPPHDHSGSMYNCQETLQTFAFDRRQAAHGHSLLCHRRCAARCVTVRVDRTGDIRNP